MRGLFEKALEQNRRGWSGSEVGKKRGEQVRYREVGTGDSAAQILMWASARGGGAW